MQSARKHHGRNELGFRNSLQEELSFFADGAQREDEEEAPFSHRSQYSLDDSDCFSESEMKLKYENDELREA